MRLTTEQEAALKVLAEKHRRWKIARIEEYAIKKQRAEEAIRAFEIERDRAAAYCDKIGISTSRISKVGMGTTDRRTAMRAIEAGQGYGETADVVAEQASPHAPSRYAYDEGTKMLTVTFQPDEFAGKIDGVTEAQALAFTVDGIQLLPAGEQWNHPVARLVLSTEGRKEALAFIENN
jgi:hypothetical protein